MWGSLCTPPPLPTLDVVECAPSLTLENPRPPTSWICYHPQSMPFPTKLSAAVIEYLDVLLEFYSRTNLGYKDLCSRPEPVSARTL